MKTLLKILLLTSLLFFISCDKDDDPETSNVDLNANAITYEMVNQTSSTTGVVRITGHIKNIGTTNFNSGENQQIAYLVERALGTTTEVVKATVNIPVVINANNEITFDYTTNWDITTEFQNDITLKIIYDPDIFLDGNIHNDDINLNNNILTIPGAQINSLF